MLEEFNVTKKIVDVVPCLTLAKIIFEYLKQNKTFYILRVSSFINHINLLLNIAGVCTFLITQPLQQ